MGRSPEPNRLSCLNTLEETWKETPFQPSMIRVYYLNTGSRAREGDQRDEGEHLRTFEEGAGKGLITKERFFPGNAPGMLDFVMGSSACWLRVLAELARIELVDEESTPILCQRLAFEEVQVIQKNTPTA